MAVESRIDSLIEAGWEVIESEFDPRAFREWKMAASQCVAALMGPDHPYTKYFGNFVSEPQASDLLAGEGILVAIRERVSPRTIEDCIADRLGKHGTKNSRSKQTSGAWGNPS